MKHLSYVTVLPVTLGKKYNHAKMNQKLAHSLLLLFIILVVVVVVVVVAVVVVVVVVTYDRSNKCQVFHILFV